MKLTKEINTEIFREYDIRGKYPIDLNEDVAYTFGKSYGSYIRNFNSSKVIVGHDNRNSGPILHNALIKGIIDSGIDVIDLGLVTTPMYYFARKKLNIPTGIMITASHNPKDDNGFKISFESYGNAYGQHIYKFRDFILENKFIDGKGTVEKYDIKKEYIELVINSVDIKNTNVKVVVDCGNGTGSIIIKDILDALNITYYPMYCESDGNFPNHQPDPSVVKNQKELAAKVVELGYDIGIGIDGDADRVGIVDNEGKILSSDMYLLIMYRYLNNNLKTRKALFDVKCSKALVDDLNKNNIEPVMYRIGNSYINIKMQEGNFDLGGEYSGHMFFRDKYLGYDDGVYAALRMIEVLHKSGKTINEWLLGINKYYSTEELKFKTMDAKKPEIVEKVKEYSKEKNYKFIDIDGVRVEFDDGWALVRASNTGPNITARFESKTQERLDEIEKEFVEIIEKNL